MHEIIFADRQHTINFRKVLFPLLMVISLAWLFSKKTSRYCHNPQAAACENLFIWRVFLCFHTNSLIWPQGYKSFFILKSAEQLMLNVPMYEKLKKDQHISGSDKPRMLLFLLMNVKIPTTVGILTFNMSRKNFILS